MEPAEPKTGTGTNGLPDEVVAYYTVTGSFIGAAASRAWLCLMLLSLLDLYEYIQVKTVAIKYET